MRLVLLAFLSLVLMAPKAEAARRDDDRSRTTSQSGSAAKGAKAEPRRAAPATAAAPARSTATPARTATPTRSAAAPARTAAPTRSAAAPSRATARTRVAGRPTTRQQASRATRPQAQADAGQVRTQRTGLVVRGASAATVSRDSANCSRRNGRVVCGARRDGVAGWQAGLPQVSMAQRDCPAGTFATLARGHENVVRCMPL